jgi:hypothetical protein
MDSINGVKCVTVLDGNEFELTYGNDDTELFLGIVNEVTMDEGGSTFTVTFKNLDE